jgi:outer membrane protein TolC
VFGPLAARQVLRARVEDVQTAKNNALLQVAEAYFDVQQARGRLAGALDAAARAGDLARRTRELGEDLVPAVEEDRALTLLADLEQTAASAREDWRTASAELTRLLRLNPTATVLPLEPPHLQVTLISPQEPVDALIPIGLTSRPELASQQALVQAALERLRQERLRPLLPSVVLTGNAGSAGGPLAGGAFASGRNGSLNEWSGRSDFSATVVWELRNLGFGNQGLIRERQGEQYQALVELFRVQDTVAAEIARAHAQLQSAAYRVGRAESGLRTALTSYAGNLKGLGQTIRFGDLLQPVVRPQEAVAALQQLASAYRNYFTSVGDYNRAQFRLYRALGYPAEVLACERPPGEPVPVDTTRPPQMAPVRSPGGYP